MTARNPKATYACINLGEVGAPPEIEDRSILLSEDIGAALQAAARGVMSARQDQNCRRMRVVCSN